MMAEWENLQLWAYSAVMSDTVIVLLSIFSLGTEYGIYLGIHEINELGSLISAYSVLLFELEYGYNCTFQ